MKLLSWLRKEDVKPAAFAARLGCAKSTVKRWIDGESRPSWRQYPKIEAETKGEVTLKDFMPDLDDSIADNNGVEAANPSLETAG